MSNDSFVEALVKDVENVLMHGPTLLYGSQSSSPGTGINPIPLEGQPLEDVYPVLYFSPTAVISRARSPELVTHELNQTGSFVACTLEMSAGENNQGVLIVSGASPYGDYQPMWTEEYYDVELNGYVFVRQAIEFGMLKAREYIIEIPIEISIIAGVAVFGMIACGVACRVLRDPE